MWHKIKKIVVLQLFLILLFPTSLLADTNIDNQELKTTYAVDNSYSVEIPEKYTNSISEVGDSTMYSMKSELHDFMFSSSHVKLSEEDLKDGQLLALNEFKNSFLFGMGGRLINSENLIYKEHRGMSIIAKAPIGTISQAKIFIIDNTLFVFTATSEEAKMNSPFVINYFNSLKIYKEVEKDE